MGYDSDFDRRGISRPRRSVGFGFLVVAALALLGTLVFPTPYVIEQPGPAYDVLGKSSDKTVITIQGVPTYETTGNLDLLTIQIVGNRASSPNWLEIFAAWMDSSRSVLPIDEVFPNNQTAKESEAESSAMMEQSQQESIAVALRKLGYVVPVELYVSEVTKGSAASGLLVATDFVRSVNGAKVATIEELRNNVNLYDGIKPLSVVVSRSGILKTFEITPTKDETGKYRIGILVGYKFDFPIQVDLQLADVGGPSGGMIFALGIYDKLTPGSLTGGKHIAGTGTIDSSGLVGPIGGIQQKLYGAAAAGAQYFLAPAENCPEVLGHIPEGLRVFKVSTFDDALTTVEKIGQGKDFSKLPTCSTN